ncbi:hypothetical protein ACSBR2_040437 [Camellia fascicularis]
MPSCHAAAASSSSADLHRSTATAARSRGFIAENNSAPLMLRFAWALKLSSSLSSSVLIFPYFETGTAWYKLQFAGENLSQKSQVFMTPGGKGWGLRTLEDLPKGAFVCEYVGEILTNAELFERVSKCPSSEEHAYPVLLDVDWGSEGVLKHEEALCLDATHYGNVARFINHSFHPFSFSSTLFFPLIWLCLFPEKCVMVFGFSQIQEVIRGTKDALPPAQVLGICGGRLWTSGKIANTSMAKDCWRWWRRRPRIAVVVMSIFLMSRKNIYKESTGTAPVNDAIFGDPVQKAEAMAFRRAFEGIFF